MAFKAKKDGRWQRKKETPDGPKDQTGEAKDMPKDPTPPK